jgi:hypothetical protein
VCALLAEQTRVVSSCLDGGNARVFARALGARLFEALLAHLKRLPVSSGLGGTQLLMDLSRYCEVPPFFFFVLLKPSCSCHVVWFLDFCVLFMSRCFMICIVVFMLSP